MTFMFRSEEYRIRYGWCFLLIVAVLLIVNSLSFGATWVIRSFTTAPEWLPAEIKQGRAVIGPYMDANKYIIVVPSGKATSFRIKYKTDYASLNGLWFALPGVKDLSNSGIDFDLDTHYRTGPDLEIGMAETREVSAYQLVSFTASSKWNRRIVELSTSLNLTFPVYNDGFTYALNNGKTVRDIKMYIVSPQDYRKLKNVINPSTPPGWATPYVKILFFVLGARLLYLARHRIVVRQVKPKVSSLID